MFRRMSDIGSKGIPSRSQIRVIAADSENVVQAELAKHLMQFQKAERDLVLVRVEHVFSLVMHH